MTVPRSEDEHRRLGLWGHRLVDHPIFCSTTRVRVRHPLTLLTAWRHFRAISKQAQSIPALLRAAFLVEGPRTFVILSVWDGEQGMLDFASRVHLHHAAVRMCFCDAASVGEQAEVWSAQWRMWAASNNLSWRGTGDFEMLESDRADDDRLAGASSSVA
jgi:hypothetical protein